MKFENSKFIVNFIIISVILVVNSPVFAIIGDMDKPIYITSESQFLDMKKNIVTFTGNVIVTQGEVKIKADKVVITRSQKKHGREIIDGYGNPTVFYQTKDNCTLAKGHASQMHYELEKNYIILSGNAYLDQRNSSISGDKITYLVKAKQIEAFSKQGKRVTAILTPSHLQNNDKTISQYKKSY